MTSITTPAPVAAERPTTAPRRNRTPRDGAKFVLATWSVLVMVFLFLPIVLVVRHSFNRGGTFIVWAHHYSTKWWGRLLVADKTWNAVFLFIGVVAMAWLIGKVSGVPLLRHWAIPVGVLLGFVIIGYRTEWYADLFRENGLGLALRHSFTAAIGATIIAVILGGLAGVALARRGGGWTAPFMLVLFLILVTPEIMDAIALLGWFVRVGGPFNSKWGPVDNGMLRLWVGQSLYASAVVTLIVRARLAGLDESLEEAAADLGATPARAFRQITLPLISSALVAGGLLSFTLCLDNTIISNAVSTSGSSTFPLYVLGTVKSTTRPFVGAAAVVLFGVTVMSLGFVYSVLRKSGASSSQVASTLVGG